MKTVIITLEAFVKSRHSRLSGIGCFCNARKKKDSGQAGMTTQGCFLTFYESVILASLAFVIGLSGTGLAAEQTTFWSRMCASCHDGKTAPDAVQLKKKFPTVEAFETAVKTKGNRCMNILKNDPKLARKVAKELGIKG